MTIQLIRNRFLKSFSLTIQCLILCTGLVGQTELPIDSTKSYCRPGGVVFVEVKPLDPSGSRKSISLTFSDILDCEQLFFENYSQISGTQPSERNLTAKQVCRKYYGYARQYVGYTDYFGDKHVLIQLLNFDVSAWEKKNLYSEWKKHFVLGVGGFFELNMRRILVNLSKRKVSFY